MPSFIKIGEGVIALNDLKFSLSGIDYSVSIGSIEFVISIFTLYYHTNNMYQISWLYDHFEISRQVSSEWIKPFWRWQQRVKKSWLTRIIQNICTKSQQNRLSGLGGDREQTN